MDVKRQDRAIGRTQRREAAGGRAGLGIRGEAGGLGTAHKAFEFLSKESTLQSDTPDQTSSHTAPRNCRDASLVALSSAYPA